MNGLDQPLFEEVLRLVDASLSDRATVQDIERLEELVLNDGRARRLYVDLMFDAQQLRRWSAVPATVPSFGATDVGLRGSPSISLPVTAGLPMSRPDTECTAGSPTHAPVFPAFSGAFSSGWPLAYLIATVIFTAGLLVAAFTHVSQPEQVAVTHSAPIEPLDKPLAIPVGRVTAMADCQWGKGSVPLLVDDAVPIGRQIRLESGLVEITYDSGARVILQGPATFAVDSDRSGHLSSGRLTARVENSTEYGVLSTERAAGNSRVLDPKSETTSKFVVCTPTAIVTDLGTEFGVEVDKQGNTTSHVFRGSVRLEPVIVHGHVGEHSRVLHEKESAQVEAGDASPRIVLIPTFSPSRFVRQIPRQTIKLLDLVDVVAGGDGSSGRRNRGIDLRNGRFATTVSAEAYSGDGRYHRVKETPLVDGVFIICPPTYDAPVQLDSAGHTATGLSAGETQARGHVWAGGHCGVFSIMGGIDYCAPGHGMIALHSNSGVTFDLAAIRRANPGWKLLRFCSVAGLAEPTSSKYSKYVAPPRNDKRADYYREGLANLRVFIDGQVRFQRREVNMYTGAQHVAVPIKDGDRFLTLVATSSDDGINGDYTMFGDPRLELLPAATTRKGDNQLQHE
jgi:hypothetical protein